MYCNDFYKRFFFYSGSNSLQKNLLQILEILTIPRSSINLQIKRHLVVRIAGFYAFIGNSRVHNRNIEKFKCSKYGIHTVVRCKSQRK